MFADTPSCLVPRQCCRDCPPSAQLGPQLKAGTPCPWRTRAQAPPPWPPVLWHRLPSLSQFTKWLKKFQQTGIIFTFFVS